MTALPDAVALRIALATAFPVAATRWGQATDEIKDMAVAAQDVLRVPADRRQNWMELTLPSRWNYAGVETVVSCYTEMTDDERRNYLKGFAHFPFIAPLLHPRTPFYSAEKAEAITATGQAVLTTLVASVALRGDHAALAALIREQIATGRSNMEVGSGQQWARGDELVTRATLLARDFSRVKGVDANAFLAACGVTP